jgi:hypothetical protein
VTDPSTTLGQVRTAPSPVRRRKGLLEACAAPAASACPTRQPAFRVRTSGIRPGRRLSQTTLSPGV